MPFFLSLQPKKGTDMISGSRMGQIFSPAPPVRQIALWELKKKKVEAYKV